MKHLWTYPPEVHEFIRANVEGRSVRELVELTNTAFPGIGFTESKMKNYKNNHNLRSGTIRGHARGKPTELFPAEVQEFIAKHNAGVTSQALTEMLNQEFGRDYTPRQIQSYRKNRHLPCGLDCKFQTGHLSHNKGRTGYCAPGCEKGWFRAGDLPENTLPVGTVMAKSDGYLWKKVRMDLIPARKNWRQLHRLVWEEHNGPIPAGHLVIFKDGDRSNCDISNLACITKQENQALNRHGLRFSTAEHTETGILIAKVKIAAEKRKNPQTTKSKKEEPDMPKLTLNVNEAVQRLRNGGIPMTAAKLADGIETGVYTFGRMVSKNPNSGRRHFEIFTSDVDAFIQAKTADAR